MNSWRLAQLTTALCGTVGLAGWVVASLAGFGSADIENAGAVPIEDRRPPSLTGKVVDAPQATALGDYRWCRQRRCGDGRRTGDGDGRIAWPNRRRRCCRPRYRP